MGEEIIVQHYLADPLLLDGYKFDLRVYVTVVSTSPLTAFICNEGLARFCTVISIINFQELYEKPTKENFNRFYMHLTNYSINKHSEDYKESENIMGINSDSKKTFTSLFKSLIRKGIDVSKIQQNIRDTVTKTMSVYGPMIEHHSQVSNNLKDIQGKMFQVLGFDILIDNDLKAWLLEINDHPSLNIFLEKDFMGGGMGKSLS